MEIKQKREAFLAQVREFAGFCKSAEAVKIVGAVKALSGYFLQKGNCNARTPDDTKDYKLLSSFNERYDTPILD